MRPDDLTAMQRTSLEEKGIIYTNSLFCILTPVPLGAILTWHWWSILIILRRLIPPRIAEPLGKGITVNLQPRDLLILIRGDCNKLCLTEDESSQTRCGHVDLLR